MSAGHEELKQEEDKIESGTIIGVGVTALIIFAVGIWWAVAIQRESAGTLRSYRPDQLPNGKQDEIGMVYQASFDRDFADHLKKEQLEYLGSTGWVDQSKNQVHIPIERAMQDYLLVVEKNGGKL
jgi:hypothetical protein